MAQSRIPPQTLDGWYVLHQLFGLSRPGLRSLSGKEVDRRIAAFRASFAAPEDPGEEGWSGAYRIVAGGADLLLLHFRPTLEGLAEAETQVARSRLAEHLHLRLDYLSVVELGLYRLTAEVTAELREDGIDPLSAEGRERLREAAAGELEKSYVQRRLRPRQPDDKPYVCFYPMDKRREEGQNWYRLSLEERNELMVEHGTIGRGYADRISQVISGSTGLDDWEWAVTLFGRDPLDFKELVSEMRFDEVSALYAEFGPFYVGKRLDDPGWESLAG